MSLEADQSEMTKHTNPSNVTRGATFLRRAALRASMSCVLAGLAGECACAQCVRAPDQPVETHALGPGEFSIPDVMAYCPTLQQVITLALTKERFATIASGPTRGRFS